MARLHGGMAIDACNAGPLSFWASLRRALPVVLLALLLLDGSGSSVAVANGVPFVWAWGFPASPVPVAGGALTGMVAVAVGTTDRLVIAADGTVWGWGNSGVLADGTHNDSAPEVVAPAQVRGPGGMGQLGGITAVAAGGYFRLARAQDGTVWAWGNNLYGQTGTNSAADEVLTVARVVGPGGVGTLGNVTAVAAGAEYSLALRGDGTVWAWGTTGYGVLGSSTLGPNPIPTPIQVAGLSGVVAIAAGDFYGLALKADGTVWAWGRNDTGQLGGGTATPATRATPAPVPGLSGITAVAAGATHALALASDGTVWAWGDNSRGTLGNGTTTPGIGAATHVVGANGSGQLGGVTAVAAGTFSSVALLADGTVRSWGAGSRLGNGTTCSGVGCDRPLPGPVSTLAGVTAIASGDLGALAIANPVTLTLNPTGLTFPAQPVGMASAAQAVVVTNPSAVSVPLGTILANGDFAASRNCGSSLAPGASCTITITFTPTATGTRTGGVSISSPVAGNPGIALSGEGTPNTGASVLLTPGQLSFASTAVGATSAAQTATLRNDGAGDLHLNASNPITTTGDFAQTNACPATLPPGAQCSISVTFAPTATGPRTGQLRVASDAPGSPHAVALSGPGVGTPSLSFRLNGTPTSAVQFADQALASTSLAQAILVSNTGTTAATFSSIAIGGDDGGEFAIGVNTCLNGVAPNASCTLGLTFRPARGPESVLRVPRAAQLTIREATTPTPYTVTLSGRAAPPPLMYVHGIKSNYKTPTFKPVIGINSSQVPLIGSLNYSLYSEAAFASRLRLFQYYQDVGGVVNGVCGPGQPAAPAAGIPIPTITDDRTMCDSQSDLGVDAILLYSDMEQLFINTGRQRKIVLICHSMGCGITRGFLAYAQELHARDTTRPSAGDLVDSVTFIEGAISGSVLAKIGGALDEQSASDYLGPIPQDGQVVNEIFRAVSKMPPLEFDLTRPAARSLHPDSAYYQWARQEVSPTFPGVPYTPALPYFTVYGDIQLKAQNCFISCVSLADYHLGDLVMVPGPPSPYAPAPDGGARFLPTQGGQNWEWGMTKELKFLVVTDKEGGGHSLNFVIQQIVSAPENHIQFGDAIDAVMVQDCQTGAAVSVATQLLRVLNGRLASQPYDCRP